MLLVSLGFVERDGDRFRNAEFVDLCSSRWP